VEASSGGESLYTCARTHAAGYVVAQVGITALTGVVSHGLLGRKQGTQLSSTREHLHLTVCFAIIIL
jgi:hypothetical protein